MTAWFAFVIMITASGVQYGGSHTIYQTKEECVAANTKVENSAMKQATPPEGLAAYHFECLPLKSEDFKKPGLEV